jgi:regulator of sigma E protease
MHVWVRIIQFLSGMSLLVFFHELGHFLAAKAFGIRVQKFYLFFDAWGFSLFKFHYKGTEFGIGWLPFGGYVRMSGMYRSEQEEIIEPVQGALKGKYYAKPYWQRLIVMFGGIIMNLLVALIIFTGLALVYGRGYVAALGREYRIEPGAIGKMAGLQSGDQLESLNEDSLLDEDEFFSTRLFRGKTVLKVVRNKGKERIHMHIAVSPDIMRLAAHKGITQFFRLNAPTKTDSMYTNLDPNSKAKKKEDRILAMNGKPVHSYDEVLVKLRENQKKELMLTVIHDGKTSELPAHIDKDGHIGFTLNDKAPPVTVRRPVSVPQSLAVGASRTWRTIAENADGFNQMVSGKVKVAEALNGPVAIATYFGDKLEWKRFWSLVALLSIGIAFINILPVPSLDGGNALIIGFEVLKGRPLKTRTMEYLVAGGFIFIMTLMSYVIYNDILRLLSGQIA